MSKLFTLALLALTVASSASAADAPKSMNKEARKQIAENCAKDSKKGTPEYKACVKNAKAQAKAAKPAEASKAQ